jgi:CheY-like chemotaxis protein
LLLVVDDEATLLDVARLVLTKAGYRVHTATNGAEAVALYAQQPQGIHAVLMDMMMPVMGGAQTIQALRRLNPAVKVIAFSGLDAVAESDRAAAASAQAFLSKPYPIGDLLATVRSVLDAGLPRTDEKGQQGDGRKPEPGKGAPEVFEASTPRVS